MIRNAQFNWERSLIKMPPNSLVTFYFAMLVVLPMKVYKTNLVTSDLLPVVMTFFNTAASLLLEPIMNMHLTICHTLFKTNCPLILTSKDFAWRGIVEQQLGDKSSWTSALAPRRKPQASCTTHSVTSWPVSATISKTTSISQFSR